MKLNKKVIAASAASVAIVGGLAFAVPSFAHAGSERGSEPVSQGQHSGCSAYNPVSLEGSITGIPGDITELRDAVRGAHFIAYKLDSATLPATEPAEGGRFVGIRPERAEDGTMIVPEITDGAISANLGIKVGTQEGTSYAALYPSDGSAPVLVTIVVNAEGVATATASGAVTVAYDAEVASEAPEMGHKGKRGGHGEGKGHRGMRGGHGPSGSEA